MKIYLGEMIHPAAVAFLENNAEVVRPQDSSHQAILEALRDVDGMIARKMDVTAEVMDAAPKMKVIGRHGVGMDSVDIPAATRRGILVFNTPGANKESVTELTMGFMLSLARKIPQAQASFKNLPKGDLNQFAALLKKYNLVAFDIEGKSLGIIGTGRIGSRVAQKCAVAFDMKIKGYDPFVAAETMASFHTKKADTLAALLPDLDFLTVHCPLDDETKGMVGKKELAMMKKGSFVINCARGGIVDEAALYEAIQSGHIAGAGLDVWEIEPPDPENPLLQHPHVIGTPHYGGTSEESLYNVGMDVVQGTVAFLRGEPAPKAAVNPEVLRKKP